MYGRTHEALARQKYEEITGTLVAGTGLTLLRDCHYIGATADGIVGNTVIEIKCPFTGQEKTIKQLVQGSYSKHLEETSDNVFKLNTSSSYYFQVQGEMAIKQCKLCHFIVWTPYDIAIIPVEYNESFWVHQLLPKLKSFFCMHVQPELLSQNV